MIGEQNGSIIFVNGTSSSGKSTLCKALQREMDTAFWHFSSDHLIEAGMHPLARFKDGTFTWSEHRPKFFDAFHRSIAAFAHAGNNLLVEHIVESPEWAHQLAGLLAEIDVFVVSATCPANVRDSREISRRDRQIGEAIFHMPTYEFVPHDIEIDTSLPLDTCCTQVVEAWRNRPSDCKFAERWLQA